MQDMLHVCEALSADDNNQQKALLDRLVAILKKLGQRGYAVREELGDYRLVSSIPIPISWLTPPKPIICSAYFCTLTKRILDR